MRDQGTLKSPVTNSYIAKKFLAIEGEMVVNLIRILALTVFYVIELINFHGLHWGWLEIAKVDSLDLRLHKILTGICVAWGFSSLGIWYSLKNRMFKPILSYFVSGLDVLLLTFVLLVADGPRSPLTVLYFLILTMIALRFDLMLLRLGAASASVSYLAIIANAKYYRSNLEVPHYYIWINLIAFALITLVLGQILRKISQVLILIDDESLPTQRSLK